MKAEKIEEPQKVAVWVVGSYLVVEIVVLSILAVIAWSAPHNIAPNVGEQDIRNLQRLVLSASAAGIGGSVFMVRQFYLRVAYWPPYGKEDPLRNAEIPRHILLPFSSVVLGPVGYCLLLAGMIVFGGLSGGGGVPLYSVVVVCFLLGFAYHDTLKSLRDLSRRLFDKGDEEEKTLARLRLLKNAQTEGLITDEEGQEKREEILEKM